jgi:hypothetical protein
MAGQVEELSDDLRGELREHFCGSPWLGHLLRYAGEIEALADHVEEMAEAGEANSWCFQNSLGSLHGEVRHLQDLLFQAANGPRGGRGCGEVMGLVNSIDTMVCRMDQVVANWVIEPPFGFGRGRVEQGRFGYNRPSIFDEDNPWTGTRRRAASPQVPVYRAIPVR